MKNGSQIAAFVLILLAGCVECFAANSVSNADELIAQHLDSIANAQNRGALKSRVVQGPVEFRIMVGGAGAVDGKVQFASDGKKFDFIMKLPNADYRGEQFIFNGDKDSVAFSTASQQRSSLGTFLFVQDAALREGLWGGELSTAWPLLNLSDRKAKVSFDGLKKVDGQDLYQVHYHPHKNTDLDILLYFEPQTLRHVRTVYSYSSSSSFATFAPSANGGSVLSTGGGKGGGGENVASSTQGGGTAETAAARQFPNRYRLEEKFSDFKTTDGVTLPTHYEVQFSQELQNGKTTLSDWDMKGLEVSNNMSVDPRAFEVK